jgi:hypothetical protein
MPEQPTSEHPTFDQLLPNAACHERYLVGIDHVVKFDFDAGLQCCRCRSQTRWVSLSFGVAFCSPACLRRFWSDWWLADIDSVPIHEREQKEKMEASRKNV